MRQKNSIVEVRLTPKEVVDLEKLLEIEAKQPVTGGLRMERCKCGRAVYYTGGGVRFRMCSKCGVVSEIKMK